MSSHLCCIVCSDECHLNTDFTFESFNLQKDSPSVANKMA